MKVSKAIRKIVALGVGATMMGATIMGATAAADLKDYPTFFVKNGNYDGVLVVRGEEDSLAAVDIAANMAVPTTTSTSGTTTTTTVAGDAWKVATSSKKYEMANSNATGSSIVGESIRDINTFIGDEELKALADGTWTTNEKDFTFQQFMFFDGQSPNNELVFYSENDEDKTADFFNVKNGQQITRYKMEFTTVAESDVTDASGTADTTGTFLDDFEDTELTLFGKKYSVVQARRTTTSFRGGDVKLVLMAGATRDTLQEGESGTYKLVDKDYTVELSFVDADEAVFLVNGEKTNKLKEGETYVLKSKKEIGVSEILYQDYAGGVHSATFYLGAQKLELKDDVMINSSSLSGGSMSSHKLRVGSEDIDGANVIIVGTNDNTTATISTIELNLTAEDDYWVGAGQKLSDTITATGEEPEVLIAGSFDIEYKGLTGQETHDIKLASTSARRYKLRLFDGDGKAVDLPVLFAASATNMTIGEEEPLGDIGSGNHKRLLMNESSVVVKDDYFVITGGTSSDGSAKSYLLQYRGADKQTKSSPKIKFKNMGSGEGVEYSVNSISVGTTDTVATLKFGGYSFIVHNASTTDSDDFYIRVDQDASGAIATYAAPTDHTLFVDSYGSEWIFSTSRLGGAAWDVGEFNGDQGVYPTWNGTAFVGNSSVAVLLGGQTNSSWHGGSFNASSQYRWTQKTPNGDDFDNVMPQDLIINLSVAAGPEVRSTLTNVTLVTPDGETEVSYGYTSMGTFIKYAQPSSDPQEITLTYPKDQRLPQVYFTSGATTSSTSTAGGSTTRVTIPVGVTKLPDEVTDVAAQNIITVGGPCANSVTAEVMYTKQGKSVPDNCAEGFEEGEARIALYDVDGKVAMVVAGYTGADTRRAGRVMASRAGELSGKEVVVQGTTASSAEIVKVS